MINGVLQGIKIYKEKIAGFPFIPREIDSKSAEVEYDGWGNPIDIKVFMDKTYILYEELNILIVKYMNETTSSIIIPLDNYPYSMFIHEERGLIYIPCLLGESINIVDCNSDMVIDKINKISYPTKVILSKDRKKIYVCEAGFNENSNGSILVIDIEKKNIIKKIEVGEFPIDLIEEDNYIFTCNMGEGSISIVDLEEGKENEKIEVGGMPIKINKEDDYIFVSNVMDNSIYRISMKSYEINKIASGKDLML